MKIILPALACVAALCACAGARVRNPASDAGAHSVIQENAAAQLFSIGPAGARRWYVVGARPDLPVNERATEPKLVFDETGNRRERFPQAPVRLTDAPIDMSWIDPLDFLLVEVGTGDRFARRGAIVYTGMHHQSGYTPVLWWGLGDGASFQYGTPEERKTKLLAALKAADGTP